MKNLMVSPFDYGLLPLAKAFAALFSFFYSDRLLHHSLGFN